jgi:hypothetical protein
MAAFLIKYWFLQTIGAFYLLYLTARFFLKRHDESHEQQAIQAAPASSADGTRRGFDRRFWAVVASVELTDLAFAIDSIIVAVGVSQELWVVVTGGFIGLLAMRFVADLCVRLLRRFPALEATAYLLVGWVGVKLLVLSFQGFCHTVLAVRDDGGAADIAASAARYPWIPEKAFANPAAVHLVPDWFFWSITGAILVLGTIYSVARGTSGSTAATESAAPDPLCPLEPPARLDPPAPSEPAGK